MKNLTTTIVFCALIGALTVASTVNPVREYSETENRALAQRPKFSFKTLFDGQFTANYEKFITDQFVARDMWITLKTRSEQALGKKDSNGVYFGEDGISSRSTISMRNARIRTPLPSRILSLPLRIPTTSA